LSWHYRDRQTGAPIATPSHIGGVAVVITSQDADSNLSVCTSDWLDRSQAAFTIVASETCAAPVLWDYVVVIDFVYLDSLTSSVYDVLLVGPRLAVGVASLEVRTGGNGAGTVTSSPAGISCSGAGAICDAVYPPHARVTLTATPAVGSTFAGWTGPCRGTKPTCTVTLGLVQEELIVGAIFDQSGTERVRFRNGLVFNHQPFTATLHADGGYTWSSTTSQFSPYQTVSQPQLGGLTVFLPPTNQTISFGSAVLNLTPTHAYSLILTIDTKKKVFVLRFFDDGTAVFGPALESEPVLVPPTAIDGSALHGGYAPSP
jgi:hypothetical protein